MNNDQQPLNRLTL